jgi:1,4-alpha-glucan branching enzyme
VLDCSRQVGNFSNGIWTSKGPFNGLFNLTRDLIAVRLNRGGYTSALQTVNINIYYQSSSDLVMAFTRGQDQSVIVVMNISGKAYTNGYYVGCPSNGTWQIRINSDLTGYSALFGNVGSGITALPAIAQPLHGFQYRINIPLGAYSTVVLSQ